MSQDVVETSSGSGHGSRMQTLTNTATIRPPLSPARSSTPRVTREDVMTASQVAELLQLPVSTVYYLARRGELPGRRLGRTWRFLRSRLEQHLDG
jgi:excisionase family DNA binding protein